MDTNSNKGEGLQEIRFRRGGSRDQGHLPVGGKIMDKDGYSITLQVQWNTTVVTFTISSSYQI